MKDHHKEHVHYHIQHAGDGQADKRCPGVPLAAEDRRFEVIQKDHRQTREIDPDVAQRLPEDLFRYPHPVEQRAGDQFSDDRHDHPAYKGDEDGRVHRVADPFPVGLSRTAGDDHVGTHGDAAEHGDHESDEGVVAPHGSHGLLSHKPSDHGDIRRVEQLLQDPGGRHRQCKPYDLVSQRAMDHVHFSGLTDSFQNYHLINLISIVL